MLSKVLSSAVIGIDAYFVEVEVDIAQGLPVFTIVGLPEVSVKESKERVKRAINNSGYSFPCDRITVNLAPADVKKDGTGFDLPIALGILAATGIISQDLLRQYLILGELSLDGSVKSVKGSLPMALAARNSGYRGIIVPYDNRCEASVVQEISVYPVKTLPDVVEYFQGIKSIVPEPFDLDASFDTCDQIGCDFSDVMGQEHVKRAMEIAAAGGHNLLMTGVPGSGKTMLARRLPTILPPMVFDEAIETTKIFSVAGMLEDRQALVTRRPFRAPHHTISTAGLIGGGRIPRPGEVSLAHNGVLFLDELTEFKRSVLEVLRQPLENQNVVLSRAAVSVSFPASFMLIAAMNPCLCGYYGDPVHECSCTWHQIQQYRSKISGPLLDRIDIHVNVPAVTYKDLAENTPAESSESIRQRVSAARSIQAGRFRRAKIHCNAQMNTRQVKTYCKIDSASAGLLETAVDRLGFSARAYTRILKISRTIADLDGQSDILTPHIAEAVQYRDLDKSRPLH